MDLADRAHRSTGDLDEGLFSNQPSFEIYMDVILKCTKSTMGSTLPEVQAKSVRVITKIRGLLNPRVMDEVDYVETTKDCRYILGCWTPNQPTRPKAFIPSCQDQDKCTATLKIHLCAVEEVKQIQTVYQEMFNENGY